MKNSILFPLALVFYYPLINGGNNKPEPPEQYTGKPKEKSCIAPEKGTCSVSLRDTKKGSERTASCTASEGAHCKIVLNAILEVPRIDLKTMKVQSLGTILKDTSFEVDLPHKENESSAFSFTPSTGDLAHKEIHVVVHKVKNAPGTRLFGKTLLQMYRLVAGDKPNDWKKMLEFESSRPMEDLKKAAATIQPDGTALIPSSVEGVPPVAVALGTKKVG
ncbi:hypothetical protein H0X06_00295 [Candidatus Dependentiae bacterium]|nr:hypothetical protein [Candidatus Dependentiae bacterium]